MEIDGYRTLHVGKAFTVLSSTGIPRQSQKAPDEHKERARSILEEICENGLKAFPDTDFKLEGRYGSGITGMGKQAVYVVKAYQLRLYCGIVADNFLVVVEAAIKKDNKALGKRLERVSKELGRLNEYAQRTLR